MSHIKIDNQTVVVPDVAAPKPVVDPRNTWLRKYCLEHTQDTLIMGNAPMPTQAVVTEEGYRIVPFDQDSIKLPKSVKARLDELIDQGYSTDRMLIIHEPNPDQVKEPPPQTWPEKLGITHANAKQIRQTLITVGTTAVTIAVAVMVIAAVVAAVVAILSVVLSVVFVGLALAAIALGVDPVLVLVLDDNTWVQVAAWREE